MFLLALRATSQLCVYHCKQDSLPIKGLELTARSVRGAPASGSSSGLAFGVLVCSFNLKSVKALGLTIALEVLSRPHRLIC
jgi:hypothetical protein